MLQWPTPVPKEYLDNPSWIAPQFRNLHDAIAGSLNQSAREIGIANTVVIVDVPDGHDLLEKMLLYIGALDPIEEDPALHPWCTLLAMLVLALPEVHWVFRSREINADFDCLADVHLLDSSNNLLYVLRLHDAGYTPLFDPSGLRNHIRGRLRNQTDLEGRHEAAHVPVRSSLAASIDDEEAYAFFTAYAAYRFGYRCHVVTTRAMFERLFGKKNQARPLPNSIPLREAKISLSLEDLYLRFPDHRPESHMSDLAKRDEGFARLRDISNRVFVTIGQPESMGSEAWGNISSYLRELSARGVFTRVLYKPLSGFFDIWERSGLMAKLNYGMHKGLAKGFEWPPRRQILSEKTGTHSTPARLRTVGERLIERSEAILAQAKSVQDAVYGALLALEALEYVGPLAPTTALEALARKHELEVQAECLSFGVEYNIDVGLRLAEIQREIREIAHHFNPKTRNLSSMDAEASIVSALALRYREFNQFDEDQECSKRIRDLYRHLWLRRHRRWAWIVWPVRWYVDLLLNSISTFVLMIILWIVVFTFLFAMFPHLGYDHSIFHGLKDAITSFVGVQPAHERSGSVAIDLLSMFASVLGFVHLGIFVSHIYSIMVRR